MNKPLDIEAERVAFEVAYSHLNGSAPNGGWNDFDAQRGRYQEVDTQDAWLLWNACASARAPVAIAPPDLLREAVAKLIKCKGRFHTEQNYAALVAAFDAGPVASVPGRRLTDARVAELELLLQKAAQGLRFRSQYTNGDPALQELWDYMMKHYPQHEGRMSGWASMRENWQGTDSGHCFGCQCEKCRAAIEARIHTKGEGNG